MAWNFHNTDLCNSTWASTIVCLLQKTVHWRVWLLSYKWEIIVTWLSPKGLNKHLLWLNLFLMKDWWVMLIKVLVWYTFSWTKVDAPFSNLCFVITVLKFWTLKLCCLLIWIENICVKYLHSGICMLLLIFAKH